MAKSPVIRVGPAGWSYPDWRRIVYPKRRPRGFHELEYLARFFDVVEINTSFYHAPRPQSVKEWIRQVQNNKHFTFTAKSWERFTHDRNATTEDELVFKQGIEPLAEAGRLGALLFQFPWSFKNDPENRRYLTDLCKRFREYPLVIEVRHSSWATPETLEMLTELGVGCCNIDQPLIGRSIRPAENVTSPVGYVRLHGRNYREWFRADRDAGERYDYLYSVEELGPWVERIENIARRSKVTIVVTNNHARGKAIANALQLVAMITGHAVQAPEDLLQEYPELAQMARLVKASSTQGQLSFAD